MADEPEYAGGMNERAVEERVERVIADLGSGRVVPGQAKRLGEAVRRCQTGHSVHRAIGGNPD
jgi:hypothetical protein